MDQTGLNGILEEKRKKNVGTIYVIYYFSVNSHLIRKCVVRMGLTELIKIFPTETTYAIE